MIQPKNPYRGKISGPIHKMMDGSEYGRVIFRTNGNFRHIYNTRCTANMCKSRNNYDIVTRVHGSELHVIRKGSEDLPALEIDLEDDGDLPHIVYQVDKKATGDRLKIYRLDHGYSIRQITEILGLNNETTVSNWENGRNLPSIMFVYALMDLYDLNGLDDIFVVKKEKWDEIGGIANG